MVDSYKKKGKLTAVIAVRKGSQRVPDKNIRPFADTNLLELKIKVLKNCKLIDEIIINSDSEKMLEIGKQYGLKTKLREERYEKIYETIFKQQKIG